MRKIFIVMGLLAALLFLDNSTVLASQQDIVFVLDNSGSMHQSDPDIMTKVIVSRFVKQLNGVDRVGIIIFDASARLAVPLTQLDTPESRQKLYHALDLINYRGQLTNTPAAIERAVYELRTNGRKDSRRSIIFLTDGIIDTGNADQDFEMTKWLIEDLTTECVDLGLKIFGVAFTENADFHLIQSLALKTKGAYFRTLETNDISKAFNEIIRLLTADVSRAEKKVANPTESKKPKPTVNIVKSAKLNPNITAVKINQPGSDAPPQTLLRNLFLIIIGLMLISLLSRFLYLLFIKKKKQRPLKLISSPATLQPPTDEKDELQVMQPKAQLIGMYETGEDNSNPNLLYLIDDPKITIGRAPQNDIVITQSTVSNFHAGIQYVNGHFQLEDYHSTNGTFIEDNRLDPNQPIRLKHGDNIKFATFDFRFLLTDRVQFSEDTILMTECVKVKI